MTDADRLDEYRDYYRARAHRYATNPLYPATAAAEQTLAQAVETSASMAEMQQRIVGDGLSLRCGIALAQDQAAARAALYARTGDDVRAQAPAEVLANVNAVTDAAALASLGSSAEQRAQQAVTVDELTRTWTMNLTALENIEVWQRARVPERWRSTLDEYAAEGAQLARDAWKHVSAEAQQHQAGWRVDPTVARAPRHRRLVPMPDQPFEQRLAEHVRLVDGV